MDSTFPTHTVDSAPEKSRAFLTRSREQFGFVPSPVAKLAASPAVLDTFFAAMARFDRASLAPLEREVLAMTVGRRNGCHYCVAMHTAMLTRSGSPPALIAALRTGTQPEDARLAALVHFIEAVMDSRGAVNDEELARFVAAGFDAQNALDVVLGISVYTLSTYANRLTRVSMDDAFAAFAP